MNTAPSNAPKPTVVQSATAKPPPHRLGFCLLLALFSAALFAGCGAAPESFEDETGEDVATETAELRTADDLGDLLVEEIAMEGGDPTVQESPLDDAQQNSNRAQCQEVCARKFSWDAPKALAACEAFCACVYPPGRQVTVGEWGSCASNFIATAK